jgi:hypothetical protein
VNCDAVMQRWEGRCGELRVEVMLPGRGERHLDSPNAVRQHGQHTYILTVPVGCPGGYTAFEQGSSNQNIHTRCFSGTRSWIPHVELLLFITKLTIRRRTVTKAPISPPRRHSWKVDDCRRRLFAPTARQPQPPPFVP